MFIPPLQWGLWSLDCFENENENVNKTVHSVFGGGSIWIHIQKLFQRHQPRHHWNVVRESKSTNNVLSGKMARSTAAWLRSGHISSIGKKQVQEPLLWPFSFFFLKCQRSLCRAIGPPTLMRSFDLSRCAQPPTKSSRTSGRASNDRWNVFIPGLSGKEGG